MNHQTATDCVVSEKDIDYNKGPDTYRIFTENCGTFQIKSSLIIGDFEDEHRYNTIEVGTTYDFKTYGYEFLGQYRNITSVKLSER